MRMITHTPPTAPPITAVDGPPADDVINVVVIVIVVVVVVVVIVGTKNSKFSTYNLVEKHVIGQW